MKNIGLDQGLINKVLPLVSSDEIQVLTEKCYKNFDVLYTKNDLTKLAVSLCYAKNYTKKEYEKLGIDNQIFIDTMKDIAIWCENNHNKGLKNIGWIKNHLKAELFKIGRLQYQIYPCKNKTLKYDKLPFDYGDNLIYIHIPQGEKLWFGDCVISIKGAVKFFEELFPNYSFTYFFCESWLLFEDNWMFMAPDSNILQFQSLFNIEYNVKNDHQAIERIFGKRHIIKKLYPQDTRLQHSTKEFLLNGGKLGEGIGTINKNEL